MKDRILNYLKGLASSVLVVIIFFAIGWIEVGAEFDMARLIVPALIALIVWTTMHSLSKVIWNLITIFAGCTGGFGYLIGLGFVGYVGLQLSAYLLPDGWFVFTDDNILHFIMGACFALIDFIVDDERHGNISVSVES